MTGAAIADISIHALVKRATSKVFKTEISVDISIHALVKRATIDKYSKIKKESISIHALVKRATKAVGCTSPKAKFQSTPS